MVNQKELQEKILSYRILQSRLEGLLKQREMIINKIVELQNTVDSINEVERTDEGLFPLGGEAHVFGKIANKEKLIVEIGANVALEKSFEEGKSTLKKRREELEKNLNEIQREMQETSVAIGELEPELQRLASQTSEAG